MKPQVIYLEAVKRTLASVYGPKQATRRRVIEMAVITLRGNEFTVEDLRSALATVCPVSWGGDRMEDLNVELAIAKYAEKAESLQKVA